LCSFLILLLSKNAIVVFFVELLVIALLWLHALTHYFFLLCEYGILLLLVLVLRNLVFSDEDISDLVFGVFELTRTDGLQAGYFLLLPFADFLPQGLPVFISTHFS
jgi:hypothetical protein